jgi:hypothetical protein
MSPRYLTETQVIVQSDERVLIRPDAIANSIIYDTLLNSMADPLHTPDNLEDNLLSGYLHHAGRLSNIRCSVTQSNRLSDLVGEYAVSVLFPAIVDSFNSDPTSQADPTIRYEVGIPALALSAMLNISALDEETWYTRAGYPSRERLDEQIDYTIAKNVVNDPAMTASDMRQAAEQSRFAVVRDLYNSAAAKRQV